MGKSRGAFSSISLPITPFQSSSNLSHCPLHARSQPEHFPICPAALFKSTDLTHYPFLPHAIKSLPWGGAPLCPLLGAAGTGLPSSETHLNTALLDLTLSFQHLLSWWTGWVGGSQVHSGSCSWHRRSGEVSSSSWGLREGQPVHPLHLWEMTRQPQSPR